MKQTLLLVILSLLGAAGVRAQHVSLRVAGGLASQTGDYRPVGAFKLGVGYEYEFDQHWTVAPALLFGARGWKDRDRTVAVIDDDGVPATDEEGRPVTSVMGRSTAANYVEVPVIFSYYHRLAESRYLVFSAGPYAAIGVSGKVKTRGDGGRTGSEKLFYERRTFGHGGLRRFDAGLQVGAGYQLPSGLTVGVEADFGLVRTSHGGGRSVSGLVALAYRFR